MTEESKNNKPRRKMDLRFYTIFWWVVLVLCVLALVLMAGSGLVVDEANTSTIAAFLPISVPLTEARLYLPNTACTVLRNLYFTKN